MDYCVHMRTSRQPRAVTAEAAPADRKDPAVRRRLSAPALRTFFNVARAWELSATEERALLGWKHGFDTLAAAELDALALTLDRGRAAPADACARLSSLDGRPVLVSSEATRPDMIGEHALLFNNSDDLRLPRRGLGGNTLLATGDTFFVYPTKLREYQSRYRGSFLHGGVTPEEVILPVALLTPKR